MIELSKSFVLATDEVYSLCTRRGPEAEFFRSFASKGFAGMREGMTQQGFYYITVAGELLFSDNTRDPRRAVRGMREALSKWKDLPRDRRLRSPTPEKNLPGRDRGEDLYPKDGLVLRECVRDVGERRAIEGSTAAINFDYAWFKAEEARQLVPSPVRKGSTLAWPDALARRLAKLHLVDTVPGLGDAFTDRGIERATISSEVTDVKGDLVTIRIAGETKAVEQFRTANVPLTMELKLLGRATFDVRASKFTAFELVAAGPRSGKPIRSHAEDKSTTIGFVFQLATDRPAEHIPPNFLGAYGWRR